MQQNIFNCQQQGQVMVEYAIILILSITLLIGGAELAATAFSSSKTSEAAKAGANEFGEVNEKRIAAQKNQKDHLRLLEGMLRDSLSVPTPAIINNDSGLIEFVDALGNNFSFVKLIETYTYENYLEYLDNDLGIDTDANGEVSADEYQDLLIALVKSSDAELPSALTSLDADADGVVTETEVNNFPYKKDSRFKKYQALIILEQINLSLLPLNKYDVDNNFIGLSKSTPLIGNHDATLMTNPSCGANYNIGLPDNDGDGVPDTEWPAGSGEYLPAIYLFNPKPIALDSCAGLDAARGNRSRISILVGGYGEPDDANYVAGLPKLNQAMYGQYTSVCLNAGNEYVSCNSPNRAQLLLKPPGKLCLSNGASPTVDSCTNDTPPIGITGYYFWGKDNDADTNAFSFGNDDAIEFRPTFQIVCNGNSRLSPAVMDDDCLGSDITSIEINTRYRSVFESFLTFGLLELDDIGMAQYFYDPSNLRSLGASLGVGVAGSELGPKHENRNPTVKPFKDFRGCYEVNIETNQISACN